MRLSSSLSNSSSLLKWNYHYFVTTFALKTQESVMDSFVYIKILINLMHMQSCINHNTLCKTPHSHLQLVNGINDWVSACCYDIMICGSRCRLSFSIEFYPLHCQAARLPQLAPSRISKDAILHWQQTVSRSPYAMDRIPQACNHAWHVRTMYIQSLPAMHFLEMNSSLLHWFCAFKARPTRENSECLSGTKPYSPRDFSEILVTDKPFSWARQRPTSEWFHPQDL